MSSSPAIRISNLSKAYRIQRDDTPRATNLGEAVSRKLRNPFRRTPTETFWALKDIDLEIERGEVVGVIGRNGAGKSTLLKVLSRITEPTTGRIELFGRVGSLLEVGTGFHPELTGRENIFLNGAILGMKRSEIRKQFDDIVDFAGVEKFLDTPVKRYSSGMYVRLAFAVAAHLEPEILIVDEVLAVGDAEFQKKCLGKMQDVAQAGRTVLLVSHQMMTVESLSTTCMHMQSGRVVDVGDPRRVIANYISDRERKGSLADLIACDGEHDPSSGFQLTSLELFDNETGRPLDTLVTGRGLRARVHYRAKFPIDDVTLSLGIKLPSGDLLTSFPSDAVAKRFRVVGEGAVECEVDRWPITAGSVAISLMARSRGTKLHWIPDAGAVAVESGDYYGTGFAPRTNKTVVLSDFDWFDATDTDLTVDVQRK